MDLLSTEIDETTVELTFADSQLVDAAERLVVVRMPRGADLKSSLAFHQLLGVQDAIAALKTQETRLKGIVG